MNATADPPAPSRAHRIAAWVRWVSVALIVLSLLVMFRQLLTGEVIEQFRGWIEGLGVWGYVAFAAIYVVAVIVLAPGSLLTLAAGGVFGLLGGLVVVSLASTLGAAVAFLIARYLARDKVAQKVKHRPRFHAVDRAISEGGWKVVAMLRLSPAVPFNLQNYMYGLTGVGFWTCVLTSWVAMLPGTFMYVYLGHIGAAALGAERQKTPGEWVLLGVGLLATIGATVYITRLARRKLREQTDIEQASESGEQTMSKHEQSKPPRRPWGAFVAAAIALLTVSGAVYATANPNAIGDLFSNLFGPPKVVLKEAYEPRPDGPTFDHSTLDKLLREHVDGAGYVDYAALKADPAALDRYIASLADAPFAELGRNEKLALLINAYNAFTLRLILDHYDTVKDASDGIKAIPEDRRWDAVRWKVGKHTWSLNQIEHEQVRPKFIEPRIHFALVCAAVGCPKLRNEAYVGDRIDAQLADQTRYIHSHDRWFRFDEKTNTAHLTKLYQWYGSDFEQAPRKGVDSVLDYVALHAPQVKQALDAGNPPAIKWLGYDWSLNSREHAR